MSKLVLIFRTRYRQLRTSAVRTSPSEGNAKEFRDFAGQAPSVLCLSCHIFPKPRMPMRRYIFISNALSDSCIFMSCLPNPCAISKPVSSASEAPLPSPSFQRQSWDKPSSRPSIMAFHGEQDPEAISSVSGTTLSELFFVDLLKTSIGIWLVRLQSLHVMPAISALPKPFLYASRSYGGAPAAVDIHFWCIPFHYRSC